MRTHKQLLSKYLLCSAAAGALALAPVAAHADEVTMNSTTTVSDGSTMSSEPMLVSGTVLRYYVDRSGYITAMDVQTGNGVQMVHFPANRATAIYNAFPTGGNIDVWVKPNNRFGAGHWNAVGSGKDRPAVWWQTFAMSDVDWLSAEPYFEAGAKQTRVGGSLQGVVTNKNGEILALVVDAGRSSSSRNVTNKDMSGNMDNGMAVNGGMMQGDMTLVRVPPQVRQIAPGYSGDERISQLFKGARVDVIGTPEAPRSGGMMGAYNRTIAASSISINGKNAGAIGIRSLSKAANDTLLNWNIGGPENMSEEEKRAATMGYHTYMPMGATTMNGGTTTTTTTTTTTSTDMATGRVMIVAADGTMLPVVRKGDKIHMQAADGTLTQIRKKNGKYTLPESMTGARMVMVMSDGTQMNMDTVNGQLMVMMADGSMAPVTLHTP